MTLFLDLDTEEFTVDPEMVDCIPYNLAAYYQALPLAREGYRVSVVMAHPENETALAVLGSLLEAQIVPVQASPEAILSTLSRLYPPQTEVAPKIVAWSADPDLTGIVKQLAHTIGQGLDIPRPNLPAPSLSLEQVLNVARERQSVLTVLNIPAGQTPYLLAQSATPMLLVRGPHLQLKRILMVWRGFSSDNGLINWMIPFAHRLNCRINVMPLTEPSPRGLTDLLSANGLAKQHLEECLHLLEAEGIESNLKFRQGQPEEQIVNELADHDYDLLAIAAEGQGEFVNRVLTALESQNVHSDRPIFILKPPTPPQPRPTTTAGQN